MKLTTSNIVLTASSLLLWAPSFVAADEVFNTTTYVNCYSEVPNFVDNGTWTYQSTGYCQRQCVPMGYSVMALIGGGNCYCGNELPANSSQTNTCNTPCYGYNQIMCGGSNAYDVYLTGLTASVPVSGESSTKSTSTTSSTSTGDVTYVTQTGQTVVVTESSSPSSDSNSSKPNTAGIAAGVVVGVVALGAIVGAVIFFLRRQQKQRVEDEFRRNAEINAFAQKPSSMSSESRWDGDYMAQRRQSNGSIADDQDFSRRILQVTNPDR